MHPTLVPDFVLYPEQATLPTLFSYSIKTVKKNGQVHGVLIA